MQLSQIHYCGAVASAQAIESANICGYQNIDVINGFSLFTPTFKNIGADAKIDLKDIVPADPNGNTLSKSDGTVYACVLDDEGNYGNSIYWKGKTLGGWCFDGEDKIIDDGAVMIGARVGIAFYNNIRVDESGNESTARADAKRTSKLLLMVSGEVDLVCKNVARTGFSIAGNSTPIAVDLKTIVPTDMNGNALSKSDGTVYVCLLDDEGNYGTSIYWKGKSLGGWCFDDESEVIADKRVMLEPGKGFAIYNNIRADESGNESTARADAKRTSSIYLSLPSPIAK